jgi:predicted N-acyltransferase
VCWERHKGGNLMSIFRNPLWGTYWTHLVHWRCLRYMLCYFSCAKCGLR